MCLGISSTTHYANSRYTCLLLLKTLYFYICNTYICPTISFDYAVLTLWAAIATTFLIISNLGYANATSGNKKVRQEVIKVPHGAVATDDRRCSIIGTQVFKEGGHAVDAAVAAALCLGVVSPASSGLGGGAFMVLRLANGQAQAFDMRETAPSLASQVCYVYFSIFCCLSSSLLLNPIFCFLFLY